MLIGALLLTDFTVMKIMLTAIAVGMVGIFGMHALGLVKLHVKPTRYAANIVGGLIFGVGFGLLGYCPGTGAAALGQGNFDAIAGILGMIAGSHLYAEVSDRMASTVLTWGNRGGIMLPDVIGVRLGVFVAVFVPLHLRRALRAGALRRLSGPRRGERPAVRRAARRQAGGASAGGATAGMRSKRRSTRTSASAASGIAGSLTSPARIGAMYMKKRRPQL